MNSPMRAEFDHALAVRRYLAASPAVRAAFGPGGASVAPDAVWVFVREMQVKVEGTGLAAATLSIEGAHQRPNPHNTAQFPRLMVDVLADSSRERASGVVSTPDAEPRARLAHSVCRAMLHRPSGFAELWGARDADPGVRVHASIALDEPELSIVPDFKGGVRLTAYYALSVG